MDCRLTEKYLSGSLVDSPTAFRPAKCTTAANLCCSNSFSRRAASVTYIEVSGDDDERADGEREQVETEQRVDGRCVETQRMAGTVVGEIRRSPCCQHEIAGTRARANARHIGGSPTCT